MQAWRNTNTYDENGEQWFEGLTKLGASASYRKYDVVEPESDSDTTLSHIDTISTFKQNNVENVFTKYLAEV